MTAPPPEHDGPNRSAPGRVDERLAAQERQLDGRDIERFLAGDQAGFEALVRRHWRRAYGIALGLTGSGDDAMDATQKAFLRVWKALPDFRCGEPFFPWLYRIVRNCALNQRRDEKRHRGEMPLEWVDRDDGRPNALDVAERVELGGRVWEEIQRLPLEQREVVMLFYFQGLKYREIAAALDIPLGTVMSRLHAARLRLRDRLTSGGAR